MIPRALKHKLSNKFLSTLTKPSIISEQTVYVPWLGLSRRLSEESVVKRLSVTTLITTLRTCRDNTPKKEHCQDTQTCSCRWNDICWMLSTYYHPVRQDKHIHSLHWVYMFKPKFLTFPKCWLLFSSLNTNIQVNHLEICLLSTHNCKFIYSGMPLPSLNEVQI